MMDKERKNRIEEVESFLRSGYCGDYQQREEAAEIIMELLDYVSRLESELAQAQGATMANVDSMQVEINNALMYRIKELEAELDNAQRLQAIDLATIAKLMQERDELRTERDALTAKLADMPDYYSYMDDDESPALDYDEWVQLGKPASWLNLDAEQLAIANELERQARARRLEQYRSA